MRSLCVAILASLAIAACGGGGDGDSKAAIKEERANCKKVTTLMQDLEADLDRSEGGYDEPQIKSAEAAIPKIEAIKLTHQTSAKIQAEYISAIKAYVEAKGALGDPDSNYDRETVHSMVTMVMNNIRVELVPWCEKAVPASAQKGNAFIGEWKFDGEATAAGYNSNSKIKDKRDDMAESLRTTEGSLTLSADGAGRSKYGSLDSEVTWKKDGGKKVVVSEGGGVPPSHCKLEGNQLHCVSSGDHLAMIYTR
jgi:hypothetical protein